MPAARRGPEQRQQQSDNKDNTAANRIKAAHRTRNAMHCIAHWRIGITEAHLCVDLVGWVG